MIRSQLSLLAKQVIGLVLRLTSLNTRSIRFVVRTFFRFAAANPVGVEQLFQIPGHTLDRRGLMAKQSVY
jgi:hypothetical protein